MPTRPTARMTRLAARWLTDQVTVQTQTVTTATRANMATGGFTLGDPVTVAALVRQPAVTDTDSPTVERSERLLTVWIEDRAAPAAGMRCTIDRCGDTTLDGAVGTIITVERDSVRAVRRCEMRLGNDE